MKIKFTENIIRENKLIINYQYKVPKKTFLLQTVDNIIKIPVYYKYVKLRHKNER